MANKLDLLNLKHSFIAQIQLYRGKRFKFQYQLVFGQNYHSV